MSGAAPVPAARGRTPSLAPRPPPRPGSRAGGRFGGGVLGSFGGRGGLGVPRGVFRSGGDAESRPVNILRPNALIRQQFGNRLCGPELVYIKKEIKYEENKEVYKGSKETL